MMGHIIIDKKTVTKVVASFTFHMFASETQISSLHPTDTFAMLQVSCMSYHGLWLNLY